MPITHQLRLSDPFGVLRSPALVFSALEWTLAENDVGVCVFTVDDRYDRDWFAKDSIIEILRSINGGPYYREGDAAWLIRKRVTTIAPDGGRSLVITALHANQLLARRIVAYETGNARSEKDEPADNMIKAIVRENFVTASDPARTTALISVASNTSAAPTLAMSFAHRAVSDVIQDVADASAAQGTYLGCEVRWNGSAYVVDTYTTSRGADRRQGQPAPLVFGQAYGNIGAITITEDWTTEVTAAYAYGGDHESVGVQLNPNAIGESPLGRAEQVRTGSTSTDTDDLESEAAALLYQQRPRIAVTTSAIDTDVCMYGIDYTWGTLATLDAAIGTVDVRVDPVQIRVENGVEQRTIRLNGSVTL